MRSSGIANVYIEHVDVGGHSFARLVGEEISRHEQTNNGGVVLTNYQIVVYYNDDRSPVIVPLSAIEYLETRNLCSLHIHTKLIQSVVCSFSDGEKCAEWLKSITDEVLKQGKLSLLFAFEFYNASLTVKLDGEIGNRIQNIQSLTRKSSCLSQDIKRLGFECDSDWRVTDINHDFKFCPSYPQHLVVPKQITDDDLREVSAFRFSRRIPTAVWRHQTNGCVIARSSQPEVGWLGWRSNKDETLLEAFLKSCGSSNKLLVLDARSYPAALANRAKGGGCECAEYYPSCEVQFMGLANIHGIRKSFNALRCLNDLTNDQSR